jgi:uncharacterized membrane protein
MHMVNERDDKYIAKSVVIWPMIEINRIYGVHTVITLLFTRFTNCIDFVFAMIPYVYTRFYHFIVFSVIPMLIYVWLNGSNCHGLIAAAD